MLFYPQTGVFWRDLHEYFGPWQTVYHRFNLRCRNGTLLGTAGASVIERCRDGLID